MMAKKGEENEDKADLLVFGYACKLFRDDERALLIDNEGHLIPWMGNESLKIDRYDGRGALYDLASHEPLDPATMDQLTPEEQHLEDMCDHERYRSLYLNEVEELTYKEEEAKRLQQQGQEYGQVGYDYGAAPETAPDTPPNVEEQEETAKPYVPPPELNVPPHLKLPETMKHNAIIERTALFIAQQGSQMEILMKLKQHGNKNFDFLSHNDPLHEFYKHVLSLIKSGSYVPTTQEQLFVDDPSEDQSKSLEGGEEEVGDHYLHPSLVTQSANSRTVPPPPTSAPSPEKAKQLASALINLPPELVRKIIKRMVIYVVRNGPAFERAILRKKDSRFDFIQPTHQHHTFYRKTLLEEQKLYNEKLSKKLLKDKEELKNQEKTSEESIPVEVITTDISEESNDASKVFKKRPLPVNFSIKKPKENKGLEVPSALPVEESSEEEEASTWPKDETAQKVVDNIEEPDKVNALKKRLKKSSHSRVGLATGSSASKSSKKHKRSGTSNKDATLQTERKLKVAQFLKDLKKKTA